MRTRNTRTIAVALAAAALILAGCAAPPEHDPAPSRALEQALIRSTVRVRAELCDGLSTGSGILTSSGILTNRHVIDGALRITVTTWDGRDHTATSTAASRTSDLAKLHAPGLTPPGTALEAGHGSTREGELLVVAGHNDAGPLALQHGRLLGATTATGHQNPVLRADVDVRPGGSGGPAASTVAGRLVGIVFAYDETTGDGLIIPISEADTLEPHRPEPVTCD